MLFYQPASIIPADLRILESKDIYVRQSSLTGESDSCQETCRILE
ncbi:MAG: hypothetical protein ACLTXR_01165 [Clostridia bacterium]